MRSVLKRWQQSIWLTQAIIRAQDQAGQFWSSIWRINFQHVTVMNAFIFIILGVLLAVDLGNRKLGLWHSVKGYRYLFYNHVEMLAFSLILIIASFVWRRAEPGSNGSGMRALTSIYVFAITVSCTLTAIIDQLISGQISMYIITLFTISTTVFVSFSASILVFGFNLAIFVAGSLYVQHNPVVLQGNLINAVVATLIAWVLSRLLFHARWRDYQNLKTIERQKTDLESTNNKLADEIEERKIIENALQESNEKLREMDILKTDFLNTVSHELRTPLTALIGFAKMIRAKQQKVFPTLIDPEATICRAVDQIKTDIDIIISEGERMSHLIEDLLDISKMEVGKYEWRMAELSIQDLVIHAFSTIAFLFTQKALPYEIDIDPDLPDVFGDRDRLLQVLINLLGNAVKFTASGKIVCRVRRVKLSNNGANGQNNGARDFIECAVIDTGRGIEAAQVPFLFTKFMQFSQPGLENVRGTGLGLAICKQIVERHGGRITVSSLPGLGSTFTFWLPIDRLQN